MFDFRKYLLLIVMLLFFPAQLAIANIVDPTKPIYSENENSSIVTNREVKESKLIHFQSVFIGDNKKVAVLNGKVVKEGETSNDVLVISIDSNKVVVKYKEKSLSVTLFSKLYLDKKTGEIRE